MADARVELPLLAKRLKAAGQVGVRREMVKALKLAAVPLVPDIQASARDALPKRGGMNAYMAAKKPRVSVRTGARTAGVSIQYKGKGAPSDTGEWRHPVFGHTDRWAVTKFPAAQGWYERGAERGTPEAKKAMDAVLVAVAAQVRGMGL